VLSIIIGGIAYYHLDGQVCWGCATPNTKILVWCVIHRIGKKLLFENQFLFYLDGKPHVALKGLSATNIRFCCESVLSLVLRGGRRQPQSRHPCRPLMEVSFKLQRVSSLQFSSRNKLKYLLVEYVKPTEVTTFKNGGATRNFQGVVRGVQIIMTSIISLISFRKYSIFLVDLNVLWTFAPVNILYRSSRRLSILFNTTPVFLLRIRKRNTTTSSSHPGPMVMLPYVFCASIPLLTYLRIEVSPVGDVPRSRLDGWARRQLHRVS